MKIFYVPIEVQKREFHGKCLLSAFAALEGYNVVLGWDHKIFSMLGQAAAQGRKMPGVLLYNGLCDAEYDYLYRYRKAGATLFALDEESLDIPATFASDDKGVWRISERTAVLAKRILTWSTTCGKAISRIMPKYAHKIRVVGNPHYDLLRVPFSKGYEIKANEIKNEYGSFILFISNMAGGRASEPALIEFHKKQMEAYGFKGRVRKNKPQDALPILINMMKKIRKEFPEERIVFRPRPTDEPNYWQEALQDISKISIDGSGNAIPWVLAAKTLIHTSSSVAHQAVFLHNPHIFYAFNHDEDTSYQESGIFKDGFCRTEDDVIAALRRHLEPDYTHRNSPAVVKAIEETYANYSGPIASLRIVRSLNELDWDREVVHDQVLPSYIPGRKIDLPFPPGMVEKKFQGMTQQMVKEQLDIYSAYIPEFTRVKVSQTADNVMLLNT